MVLAIKVRTVPGEHRSQGSEHGKYDQGNRIKEENLRKLSRTFVGVVFVTMGERVLIMSGRGSHQRQSSAGAKCTSLHDGR